MIVEVTASAIDFQEHFCALARHEVMRLIGYVPRPDSSIQRFFAEDLVVFNWLANRLRTSLLWRLVGPLNQVFKLETIEAKNLYRYNDLIYEWLGYWLGTPTCSPLPSHSFS